METIKINENEVRVSRTEETVVDFETLVSQKAGILEQQQVEHDALDARDIERAAVIAEIDISLATGIKAKPEPVVEPVDLTPVEEIII